MLSEDLRSETDNIIGEQRPEANTMLNPTSSLPITAVFDYTMVCNCSLHNCVCWQMACSAHLEKEV